MPNDPHAGQPARPAEQREAGGIPPDPEEAADLLQSTKSLKDAHRVVGEFADHHNRVRSHGSLGYVPQPDRMEGRREAIHVDRERKLEAGWEATRRNRSRWEVAACAMPAWKLQPGRVRSQSSAWRTGPTRDAPRAPGRRRIPRARARATFPSQPACAIDTRPETLLGHAGLRRFQMNQYRYERD